MAIKYVDGRRLKGLLIAGSEWLVRHRELLDQLNVYPVPDGDTGTNMSMTFKAIEDKLKTLDRAEENVDTIAKVVSEAAILGARGNSGTILSQIIYGFLKSLLGKDKIYAKDIAKALNEASNMAYNAVNIPVEGTILTIIRRVAEEAEKYVRDNEDLIGLMEVIRKVSESEVEKTIEMLPKLKEAGVVDAGAKGLFYVFEGFEKFIKEGVIATYIADKVLKNEIENVIEKINTDEIKYKYCTEFVIDNSDFPMEDFGDKLNVLGDSMVTARIEGKTKAHIHTNNPGLILEYAITLGNLLNIKIENMTVQHSANLGAMENKPEDRGIIMIADTKEIADIYFGKGANSVIIGGQTKNPSVGEIEEAVKATNAKKIFLFPNNKNIFMAAKTVKTRSHKNVEIIETKSMLEGYFALKNIDQGSEKVRELMDRNISIEITKSLKNTKSLFLDIEKGDFIAIVNGNLEFADGSLIKIIKKIQDKYFNHKADLVTILKGKEADLSTKKVLTENYEHIKFEILDGNQENYFYYIYISNTEKLKEIKKEKVAVVVDSVSDLEPDIVSHLPMKIIPLKVRFQEDVFYKEGIDISKKEFWKRLAKEEGIPQTSQPSPAEFIDIYRGLFNEGYTKIISVHASSKTSGVSQAAKAAINLMDRSADIKIIDSMMLSMGIGKLALEAGEKAKEGKPFEEIIAYLEKRKGDMKIYFAVKDLKYLKKGGRISAAASLAGGLLGLKPVMKMEDGFNVLDKKVFGEKSAIKYIEKMILKESKKGKIGVMTASGMMDDAIINIEEYVKNLPNSIFEGRLQIGAIVGSHTGPAYGLVIYPIEE